MRREYRVEKTEEEAILPEELEVLETIIKGFTLYWGNIHSNAKILLSNNTD